MPLSRPVSVTLLCKLPPPSPMNTSRVSVALLSSVGLPAFNRIAPVPPRAATLARTSAEMVSGPVKVLVPRRVMKDAPKSSPRKVTPPLPVITLSMVAPPEGTPAARLESTIMRPSWVPKSKRATVVRPEATIIPLVTRSVPEPARDEARPWRIEFTVVSALIVVVPVRNTLSWLTLPLAIARAYSVPRLRGRTPATGS